MTHSSLAEIVGSASAAASHPRYVEGVPAHRTRPPASLRAAVVREAREGALVVEYKRASPSSAAALPAPRSVEEFVRATDVDGVVAYSCLATAPGFDGAPAHVAELAARTERPVLFKEFIVHERQLEVAQRTGASAVLLIARLETERLLERPLAELARQAHRRGLEVLLELHGSAELSAVDGLEADVYGVNTRDLATLALDRSTAYGTIEAAVRQGLRPLLGLSGVEGPSDARELWSRGCDGLLVGTAVSRSPEPARLLASLRRPPEGRS